MPEARNIVIIGSGMAGYTLLREIRKIDKEIKITLICNDNGDFYSKPMLSNALDKQKTPDTLVVQSAEQMVTTQNFELINKTFITGIDTANQIIQSSDKSWSYQSLILATGAKPFRLPIKSTGAADILSVNHLDQYRHFYNKLQRAESIAIIGPGLIGCEFANDLINTVKNISIIGPDHWPISTLLPEPVGQFLRNRLEQIGIHFYLKNTVQSVDKKNGRYELQLEQGEAIEADLVLSAVGLRANIDLAQDTDLSTGRGYATDKYLHCSEPNIYALGDCAEVAGHNLPFILPIMQCARALAKTLTGEKTAVSYPAMPVAIKTPACPLVVAPPSSNKNGQWETTEQENGIKAVYMDHGKITGFALAGDAIREKQSLSKVLPDLL